MSKPDNLLMDSAIGRSVPVIIATLGITAERAKALAKSDVYQVILADRTNAPTSGGFHTEVVVKVIKKITRCAKPYISEHQPDHDVNDWWNVEFEDNTRLTYLVDHQQIKTLINSRP